jgi:serine/threonine-protein kinase
VSEIPEKGSRGALDEPALATFTPEELARTLRIAPGQLADVATTIAKNPDSTIEPADRSADTGGRQALVDLGEQRGEQGIAAGLTLGTTIGEGGMGIVRLATQRSLGRRVAVKTLREEAKSDHATLRLLREAWVTGSLEHPNIVPVYDLGLDDDGSPIIVLKHIEGAEWSSLVRDEGQMRTRFGAGDLLEHNLRIFIAVCNAVSLAHAKGVIHRDLKPENVMIGRFGEVYLVDWGIAVSLKDDPTGRLPLASEAKDLAGTPCYMAPEMLGAGASLSERTDVYLLGAVLYEILTGKPPHTGSFQQIVASILLSNPAFPPSVPPELAEIAKKAMSRDPKDRWASPDEVKERIEWYLRHRGALALSMEAARRLAQMRELMTAPGDAGTRDRIYHLFAEARFGFRQAMSACEDDAIARRGLHDTIETIVVYELERGTAEAAAAALAELEDAPASLRERVAEALARRDKERERIARLERLDADLDPSIGRRTRVAATFFLGVVWTLAPFGAAWLDRRYDAHPAWFMYAWTIALVVLGGAVFKWGRESLSKTLVNRRLRAIGMTCFAMQLVLEVGCNWMSVPFDTNITLHFFLWATVTCAVSVFLDKRLWAAAAGYVVSFFVVARVPSWRWTVMSVAHGILLVSFVLAWGSLEDRPRRLQRWIEEKRRGR